jgi:gliding motility-associated lipoprotein GldD
MFIKILKYICLFGGILAGFSACKEEPIYYPKPRNFPKIEFPARVQQKFDVNYCQFSFEYPTYMNFVQDTTYLNQSAKHACWFNLHIHSLNADIHFTYTPLDPKKDLAEQIHKVYRDGYRMSDQHDSKATLNEDLTINNPTRRVFGILYNLEGRVASPFQVVLTDSLRHAVRASLYFNTNPKADSLAPIIEFVKADIMGILNSFEWKP